MKVKNLTVNQVIAISKKVPVNYFDQAVEIATVFQNKKLAYIPQGSTFFGFWKMIGAIWCGGYIAGVQAERDRRNRSKSDISDN